MNLICFPHYTCGGLLCDIMTDKFSVTAPNGGIASIEHSIGKIGDSASILTDYDVDNFMYAIKDMPVDSWIGTHCHPEKLPLDKFDRVIVVTTMTYRSKIYRWMRAYYHYFLPQWVNLSGMSRTDKIRETAKNYVTPFCPVLNCSNVENLEFFDVVESSAEFTYITRGHNISKHMTRWANINNFLYSTDMWNTLEVTEFAKAEHELYLNRYYRYE
jgi:hypothetical protein